MGSDRNVIEDACGQNEFMSQDVWGHPQGRGEGIGCLEKGSEKNRFSLVLKGTISGSLGILSGCFHDTSLSEYSGRVEPGEDPGADPEHIRWIIPL